MEVVLLTIQWRYFIVELCSCNDVPQRTAERETSSAREALGLLISNKYRSTVQEGRRSTCLDGMFIFLLLSESVLRLGASRISKYKFWTYIFLSIPEWANLAT